jgi:hypothetical protein
MTTKKTLDSDGECEDCKVCWQLGMGDCKVVGHSRCMACDHCLYSHLTYRRTTVTAVDLP